MDCSIHYITKRVGSTELSRHIVIGFNLYFEDRVELRVFEYIPIRSRGHEMEKRYDLSGNKYVSSKGKSGIKEDTDKRCFINKSLIFCL